MAPARTQREQLAAVLRRGAHTLRELSARTGMAEREIPDHLEHLRRSARARGERLVVTPARCLRCGFVFDKRAKLTRPSRCPECKSERIDPPAFSLA